MTRITLLALIGGVAAGAIFAIVAYISSNQIPVAGAVFVAIGLTIVFWAGMYFPQRRANSKLSRKD